MASEELLAFLGVRRSTEPTPAPPDPREALFQAAREKGFPALILGEKSVKAGEAFWRRFCDGAHPGWLELAGEALREA